MPAAPSSPADLAAAAPMPVAPPTTSARLPSYRKRSITDIEFLSEAVTNCPTVWGTVIWFNTGVPSRAFLPALSAANGHTAQAGVPGVHQRRPSADGAKNVLRYPLQADDAPCQHRGGGSVDADLTRSDSFGEERFHLPKASRIRPAGVVSARRGLSHPGKL